ncbi:MAG: uracil-DNA glycosylase [Anaerolineales bacterium]
MTREELLAKVAEETAVCTKCALHHSRKHAVPGAGPVDAEIMFIGEGPGFHENEQGLPFVGAAGRFLEELLQSIGLERGQVFITNVVKCRPPGNRDPQADELEACDGYLERQIQAINPKVIVTLGRFSMQKFLPNAKISQAHGQAVRVRGRLVVPFYHPAAALHQPSLRPVVEADFQKLPEWIDKAGDAPEYVELPEEDSDDSKPEQLSLF